MGLEYRGNRKYYYRKKRVGRKVVSVYEASGLFAVELDEAIKKQRQKEERMKSEQRESFERERLGFSTADDALAELSDVSRACETIAHLLTGHIKINRRWRSK